MDFVNVGRLLSDEEKAVRDRVREYVDREHPTALFAYTIKGWSAR